MLYVLFIMYKCFSYPHIHILLDELDCVHIKPVLCVNKQV